MIHFYFLLHSKNSNRQIFFLNHSILQIWNTFIKKRKKIPVNSEKIQFTIENSWYNNMTRQNDCQLNHFDERDREREAKRASFTARKGNWINMSNENLTKFYRHVVEILDKALFNTKLAPLVYVCVPMYVSSGVWNSRAAGMRVLMTNTHTREHRWINSDNLRKIYIPPFYFASMNTTYSL